MKYVLDTNVVSALMKGDEVVVARLAAVPKASVCIPQPVLAEIAYGIARLPPSKKRELLKARMSLIAGEMQRAEWSDDVSERFGAIKAALEKKGRRIEDMDAAIAAHAGPGDILVTANVDDMIRVPGIALEDWSKKLRR